MTTEERLNRIEHVTAGLAEQHRKDHEEDRQLWRDTQRQLAELATRMIQTDERLAHYAAESREADQRLAARIEEVDARLGRRIEEVDARLGRRIEELVSAIGQLTARMGIPPQPPPQA